MVTSLDDARALLRSHPLVDGHNDLAWRLREFSAQDLDATDLTGEVPFTHTDLPRLARGGVGAQCWSVFVPAALRGEAAVAATLEQIDFVHAMAARYPGRLELALTSADIGRIFATGKVASMLGAEGGHSIACSLGVLRAFHRLGVRYLTLTHNENVPWADSATDSPAAGGLTAFGRAVVSEMQWLGMLVDLSHVAPATMRAALDTAAAPVIFSHSSALALCDHPRNVPDDVLAALAANNGVCMVTFVPAFVSQRCRDWERDFAEEMERRGLPLHDRAARQEVMADYTRGGRPEATLAEVADHIEHVREVAGVEHVGIGGDYDGTDQLPEGLQDVSCYPALFAELLDRGWSRAECALLAGGNLLRVMAEAEAAARALSAQRGPSMARIEDLDGTAAGVA